MVDINDLSVIILCPAMQFKKSYTHYDEKRVSRGALTLDKLAVLSDSLRNDFVIYFFIS